MVDCEFCNFWISSDTQYWHSYWKITMSLLLTLSIIIFMNSIQLLVYDMTTADWQLRWIKFNIYLSVILLTASFISHYI